MTNYPIYLSLPLPRGFCRYLLKSSLLPYVCACVYIYIHEREERARDVSTVIYVLYIIRALNAWIWVACAHRYAYFLWNFRETGGRGASGQGYISEWSSRLSIRVRWEQTRRDASLPSREISELLRGEKETKKYMYGYIMENFTYALGRG